MKKLEEQLEENIRKLQPSEDFSAFHNLFNEALDSTCKLDKPKVTKRNCINNPWITEGIITAIEREHEICKEWIDSMSKAQPLGDQTIYQKFSDYRKALKKIIKTAKSSYFCNKISEN